MKTWLLAVGVAIAMFIMWRLLRPSPEEAAGAERAGVAFGASHDAEGCLAEALARGVSCEDDLACESRSQTFLRSCLPASHPQPPAPGFCERGWSVERWEALGRPHHGGRIAEDAVRDYCRR